MQNLFTSPGWTLFDGPNRHRFLWAQFDSIHDLVKAAAVGLLRDVSFESRSCYPASVQWMSTRGTECLHLSRDEHSTSGAIGCDSPRKKATCPNPATLQIHQSYKDLQHRRFPQVRQHRVQWLQPGKRAASFTGRDARLARSVLSVDSGRHDFTMVPPSVATTTTGLPCLRATEAARNPRRCSSLAAAVP
jgi:hypothetical protein